MDVYLIIYWAFRISFKHPSLDLALNRPASQINTVHGGVASRAVDGKTTTAWSRGSCTHTEYSTDPWWRVDLGSSLPVAEVVIVNRACTRECATYLTNFEIKIGKLSITMKASPHQLHFVSEIKSTKYKFLN